VIDQPSAGTKARIVGKAMDLFWRQGYEATGVAQIQAEAGVLPGSFYFFFKSKEALLLAVLDRYMEILHSALRDPVVRKTRDPLERVFTLLDFYRKQIKESRFELGCPIGNLALELGNRSADARQKLNALFDTWRAMVEAFFVEAQERFPEGTDFKALSTFVLTTMEGGIMLARANQDVRQFDRAVKQLRNYLELMQIGAKVVPRKRSRK
jgi:TetR/AcrR family transcriptional repressor of nem operon